MVRQGAFRVSEPRASRLLFPQHDRKRQQDGMTNDDGTRMEAAVLAVFFTKKKNRAVLGKTRPQTAAEKEEKKKFAWPRVKWQERRTAAASARSGGGGAASRLGSVSACKSHEEDDEETKGITSP